MSELIQDNTEFKGVEIEKYEDQLFDTTKFRYASPMLVEDMYRRHGDDYAKKAIEDGFIPYYDEIGFVRWKQKKG